MPTDEQFAQLRADHDRLAARVAVLESLAPPDPDPDPVLDPDSPAPADVGFLVTGRDAIMAAPMTGSAWSAVKAAADGNLGAVDFASQTSRAAALTYAAALAHVRTGKPEYREKVVAQLRRVPGAPTPPRSEGSRGGVLSVVRQLPGYIIAADLVGHRDPAFVAFVKDIRTRDIGGHGRWDQLAATSANTANNWGTWALASRVAADLYLGDTADLAKAVAIFKRYTGKDPAAHNGWQHTADFDPSWSAADPYVGINPANAGGKAGAVVEDICRSAGRFPAVDEKGLSYSWEALTGSIITAKLLSRAGHPDVFEWGDRALLRAARFIHSKAGTNGSYPPRHGELQLVPVAINTVYGVNLGPVRAPGNGWCFGFTDWLF